MSEIFKSAMLQLCKDVSTVVHYPTRLHIMIDQYDGIEAARRTVREMTETYKKLWEARRLDLSVEALVLKPEWAELFTAEELATARQRLEDSDYYA